MIELTLAGRDALRRSSDTPSDMRPATSYVISGTDPDGYTRVVTRNVITQDHAATTINHLAVTGWTAVSLYAEQF